MKHIWTVVCERILEDPLDKTVSLIQILEALNISPVPGIQKIQGEILMPTPLTLVTYWTRTNDSVAEEFRLRAGVRMPDGTEKSTPEILCKLTNMNYRQVFRLGSIPYMGLGRYWFYVEQTLEGTEWKRAAEVPFELREAQHGLESKSRNAATASRNRAETGVEKKTKAPGIQKQKKNRDRISSSGKRTPR